jgi:2,4-dienoyl-CoA reductase-like NADH-dependent reductase (Old Yellow Enzyme family)
MAGLFDTFKIRGIELRNRIAVSPMVQISAIDGFATDWHLVHLGSRAVGGAGLVMTEATAVAPDARVTINDLGIWKDEHIGNLSRICEFIHKEGATAGIQIAHGGRKSNYAPPFNSQGMQALRQLEPHEGGWSVRAPSAIQYSRFSAMPQEMSVDEIREACALHVEAAVRADAAGFDLIEIHAAHGYLPHCFYSPLSNQRDDHYGGSFENRIRFSREIARAVRLAIPDHKVLAFRISYTDWIDGGWSLDDAVRLARHLKDDGVDLIDVSSGGTAPTLAMQQITTEMNTNQPAMDGRADLVAKIPLGPSYQVPGAVAIKCGANIPVAAVGLINDARQADDLISSGKVDLVMLARALLRNPYWAQQAAVDLGETNKIRVPVQYYLGWRDHGTFAHVPVSAPSLDGDSTLSHLLRS